MPHTITDANTFENSIKNTSLTVVHFAAEWVEQCSQVDDLLDTLAKQPEYGDVKFCKCQAEDLPEVSLKNKIEAVPTIILFQHGKAIDRVDGADASKIASKIKQHSVTTVENNTANNDNLETRLKELINRHNVMLFMKGDRNVPRCGFSKQIISILNDSGADYDTFDILTDEDVRQGLKTYSDWPTYPQLYVKGELIGGLDIVKEMQAGGDLKSALSA